MKKVLLIASALIVCASAGTAFGDVVTQSEGCNAPDESCIHLARNKNGLHLSGTVSGLIAGHTYTVWWIVFDGQALIPLVLNASGGIANRAGDVHFGARLGTGTYEEGTMKPRQVFLGGTLDDPLSAFVILDILDHGKKIPGLVKKQISTIDANCEPAPDCGPPVASFFFFPPGP